MLLLRKLNKAIVTLVVVLLFVQFITPTSIHVVSQGNTNEEATSFKNQHGSGITVSVLLTESLEEKNSIHRIHFTLLDFTFHTIALKQVHANIYAQVNNVRPSRGPIFKLIHAFLI